MTAVPHSGELCCDRLHPAIWETFLPLPHDRLSVLARLRSRDWIEAGSRRRIRREKIRFDAEFWLKVGVRYIDLAQVDMAAIARTPNTSGNEEADRLILPKYTKLTVMIVRETADMRDIAAMKDLLMAFVGSHAYIHPDSAASALYQGL